MRSAKSGFLSLDWGGVWEWFGGFGRKAGESVGRRAFACVQCGCCGCGAQGVDGKLLP